MKRKPKPKTGKLQEVRRKLAGLGLGALVIKTVVGGLTSIAATKASKLIS
mgnify:CR=1 FL=1